MSQTLTELIGCTCFCVRRCRQCPSKVFNSREPNAHRADRMYLFLRPPLPSSSFLLSTSFKHYLLLNGLVNRNQTLSEASVKRETTVCLNGPCHVTVRHDHVWVKALNIINKIHIYCPYMVKDLKSPEPVDRFQRSLVCCIDDSGPSKFICIMIYL